MFQTPPRKPTARPMAIRISGVPLTSSSASPRTDVSGWMKISRMASSGGLRSISNSTMPASSVSTTARNGVR